MKKIQYSPQESLERIKLMMGYDMSKTLNENREIIFEQESNNFSNLATSFLANTFKRPGTNITKKNGIMDIIYKLKNKSDFDNFNNELKKQENVSFEQVINDELESDNGLDAVKISNHLRSIGVNSESGVTPYNWSGKKKLKFNKNFKIVGNVTDSGSDKPKPTTTPLQTPATYQDVVNGKGILKMGMKGSAANQLQQMLVALGYNLGTSGPQKNGVDSDFGKLTDAAVREFQSKNPPLKVDGQVGRQTASLILKKYGEVSQKQTQPDRPQSVQDLVSATQTSTRLDMARPNPMSINSAGTQASQPQMPSRK